MAKSLVKYERLIRKKPVGTVFSTRQFHGWWLDEYGVRDLPRASSIGQLLKRTKLVKYHPAKVSTWRIIRH